jgi:hypothetical protein
MTSDRCPRNLSSRFSPGFAPMITPFVPIPPVFPANVEKVPPLTETALVLEESSLVPNR